MDDEPLAVQWHSTLMRPFGYAMVSRALIFALQEAGVEAGYRYLYGPGTVFPVKEEDPLPDTQLEAVRQHKVPEEAPHVAFGQADAFEHVKPGRHKRRYRIGYTMLEVSGLPDEWVRQANEMEEVWAPSPFNAWTFRKSGVERPVCVMPLGVDTTLFNTEAPGHPLDDVFTFLSIFEWGERKAPEVLLTVFNRTFRRDEPVVLLCKYDNNDGSVDVVQQVADMALDPEGGRIVFIANQSLPYRELASLYRSADCFVLPTRGEGWGMPILEAMACGLPVIATCWSAQQTFMTDANSYPLQVSGLVPAKAKCPYYEGFQWAEPDLRHLARLLRHVYEHPEEARGKGALAARDAREKWTIDMAGRHIRERLVAIETERARGARPRFDIRMPEGFKPKVGFDISRGVGGNVTGVGRSALTLLAGLAALDAEHNPFEYVLLPGLADFVHPSYVDDFEAPDLADERFTVYRGPLPAFSNPDHFVPGLQLVHSTAYAAPDTGAVPLVVTVHDMTFITHPQFHTPENIVFCDTNLKRAIDAGCHFVSVSESTRRDMVAHYGLAADRVTVVPNAVDDREFRVLDEPTVREVREAHDLPERYFLAIGSLEPRKNLATVIEAMRLYDGPEKLAVVGLSGWKNRELMEAVERESERVVVLGYVPQQQLPALYNGAVATLFPTLYEGFGLPVLESMACGTPVITSNNSSIPEVAGDACILLDDPTDAGALAAAMSELAGDAGRRQSLSEEGLAQAAKFSPESIALNIVALYARLLGVEPGSDDTSGVGA